MGRLLFIHALSTRVYLVDTKITQVIVRSAGLG